MRDLRTRDICPFLRLVKALGIRDEIKAIAAQADTAKDVADLAALQFGTGMELVLNLSERAGSQGCESAIYDFVASLWDCSVEEAKDVPLIDLVNGLKELWEGDSFLAFFKSAASAMR